MNFLNLKPEAFGLDISDLSLKIVKFKKRGKSLKLTSWGEFPIKAGLINRGEIKDTEKLAEVIKESLKKVRGEKIKTKYVIASLPEEESFLQVIQMPKIAEEDLKSAVIYEAENYIPLTIEKVYLDYQVVPPVSNHLDHLDVLIAALPRKTINPYTASLKLAGLQPLVLEIESLSVGRALIKNGVTSSPILLIDLGVTKTSFIIFSGYSLRFTSSIPVSSSAFTEIISKNLNLSFDEAEKLKIKHGLEEKFKMKNSKEVIEKKLERGEIFEALIPALVDLTQQIKICLNYYQTHSAHEHLPPAAAKISKILLCGGGANLKGLSELLEVELKLPVELGNPWVNVGEKIKKPSELDAGKSLSYATAVGLALREITNEK